MWVLLHFLMFFVISYLFAFFFFLRERDRKGGVERQRAEREEGWGLTPKVVRQVILGMT